MARILTITSGKGGVGKTNISVNLAVYLAQKGFRTCLFDADLGLANINILLNMYPEYTLEDVISGKKSIKEIVVRDKSGIDIIPGSSGIAKMAELSASQLASLARSFSDLDEYDYFIFDTSAGVSKNVIAFCMSASEVILVITPEPTSLTDAYALIKILSLNGYKQTPKVIVNQSQNPKNAQLAYNKLKDTVFKFLGIQLSPLGTIVADARVIEAVAAQHPFITLYPNTQASKCLKAIADHLLEKGATPGEVFTLDTFWDRCVGIFSKPLKMPVKKTETVPSKEEPPGEHPDAMKAISPGLPATDAVPEKKPEISTWRNDAVQPVPAGASFPNEKLLERLTDAVSAVTRELSGIRMALEQGSRLPSGSEQPLIQAGDGKPPLIPIDFEAFLKEHSLGK